MPMHKLTGIHTIFHRKKPKNSMQGDEI